MHPQRKSWLRLFVPLTCSLHLAEPHNTFPLPSALVLAARCLQMELYMLQQCCSARPPVRASVCHSVCHTCAPCQSGSTLNHSRFLISNIIATFQRATRNGRVKIRCSRGSSSTNAACVATRGTVWCVTIMATWWQCSAEGSRTHTNVWQ